MDHLSSKTTKELIQYANDNGIDLQGAKTKTKILSILLDTNATISYAEETTANVITSNAPTQKRVPTSSSSTNENNAIISRAAERKPAPKETPEPQAEKSDKVALYVNRNLRWNMLGTLSKGYNIVTKEAAEKWLTIKGVRKATPEEVATYYGKN